MQLEADGINDVLVFSLGLLSVLDLCYSKLTSFVFRAVFSTLIVSLACPTARLFAFKLLVIGQIKMDGWNCYTFNVYHSASLSKLRGRIEGPFDAIWREFQLSITSFVLLFLGRPLR